MSGLIIGLLIIGGVFFVGSFFFVEKLSSSDIATIEKMSEKEINVLLEKQLRQASDKIEQSIDTKLTASLAGAERQIHKTANEQIMSITDHGDSVRETITKDLEAAAKSHDEIVFMHSMLHEKEKRVTELTKDSQALESQLRALKQAVEDDLFAVAKDKGVDVDAVNATVEQNAKEADDGASAVDIVAGAKSLKEAFAEEIDSKNAEEEKDGEEPFENVNEKILSLHREGYSEIEIAKRLGKGLGEIKLVLGLFDEEG